jgi:hypothetical protein
MTRGQRGSLRLSLQWTPTTYSLPVSRRTKKPRFLPQARWAGHDAPIQRF